MLSYLAEFTSGRHSRCQNSYSCFVHLLLNWSYKRGMVKRNLTVFRLSAEKAMAPHSSALAWKIPGTEEPGRLQSMGSQRVEYDWVTELNWTEPHFQEKAMATHSSTLAWKIPWAEEPGRLQSMGSRRVGHDWATSLSLFTFMHWRREWEPTPEFLPGESYGWGSLVSCSL